MMNLKKTILVSWLVVGSFVPAYANEPEMAIFPVLFFIYPMLTGLIFLMPLGLFRKIMALITYFILNIFITATGFKFDSIKQEAFIFIAPITTWIAAILIAFVFKKLHILDMPNEK